MDFFNETYEAEPKVKFDIQSMNSFLSPCPSRILLCFFLPSLWCLIKGKIIIWKNVVFLAVVCEKKEGNKTKRRRVCVSSTIETLIFQVILISIPFFIAFPMRYNTENFHPYRFRCGRIG